MDGLTLETILKALLAGALGFVGYFLKRTAEALDRVQERSIVHGETLANHSARITALERTPNV